jgi:hypothetical protein
VPKLLAFLPCQHILVDQDNLVSLVIIMEDITAEIPADAQLPLEGSSPIKWGVFTMWASEPDDSGKEYEQLLSIVLPDGREVLNAKVPFAIKSRQVRNIINIEGFPISHNGPMTLRLSLGIAGADAWTNLAEYVINVVYKPISTDVTGDPVTSC